MCENGGFSLSGSQMEFQKWMNMSGFHRSGHMFAQKCIFYFVSGNDVNTLITLFALLMLRECFCTSIKDETVH